MDWIRKVLKNIFKIMIDEKYSNEDEEVLEYVFIGCSFEVIKLIMILGLLLACGLLGEGIVICTVMFLSKPFIGGYHEETQLRCLVSTIISIFFIIIISKNSSFTYLGNIMVIILSIFCIWNQAPLIDQRRPITKVNLINRNRIIGTSILAIFGLMSILAYEKSRIYILITWTIVFQVLMLFRKNMKLSNKNEINN